jgi:hypothetical protein
MSAMQASSSAPPIREDWQVSETIERFPDTGAIFLQIGPMFVTQPGDLYVRYPGLTIAQYAARHGRDVDALLRRLNAVARIEPSAPSGGAPAARAGEEPTVGDSAPVTGPIGYTGAYRDRPGDIRDISVVAVLEARGPE